MEEKIGLTERLEQYENLLWDILQELREANGKIRNTPDVFCSNCGEVVETEEHPTGTHKPSVLS